MSHLHFDKIASDYDERWKAYLDHTMNAFISRLSLQGNESIIDVGCGTGELEHRLLEEYPQLIIVGRDPSLSMLERAQEKRLPNERIIWSQGVAESLPDSDDFYDLWVACNCFHHFPDPKGALAEARRVLKPEGRILILDWCVESLLMKAFCLYKNLFKDHTILPYSMKAMEALLESSGFEITRKDKWRWGRFWKFHYLEAKK